MRHECTPSGRHSKTIPVAPKGQHDDPRSSRESTVKDPTVIAQSHSEDVNGIRPHVLEEKSPEIVNVEVTRLQDPEGLILGSLWINHRKKPSH